MPYRRGAGGYRNLISEQNEFECVHIYAILSLESLGGVPPEQKMLKEHLPRVIFHQVY